MALITASYTTAQVESVTRRTVLSRFLRESGLGEYGTATDGSTTTIVDTSALKNGQFSADVIPGGWARISYDAGGAAAAPETEIKDITAYAPSTGTITTSAFSAATASGDKYEIWRFVHPQRVLDTLDQVLTEDCYLPHWAFLTEVPDGDMEQNNTTDWAATNASIAKSTAEPLMWGKRYMTVTTSATNGYVAPATVLKVVPGRRYHLSALVRASAASTTAEMTIYDVSNSASIASATTTSQTAVWLWKEFTAPADCHQVSLRVGASENNVTVHYGYCVFFDMESHDLPLPWWVRDEQQVKAILRPRWDDVSGTTRNPIPHGTVESGRWNYMNRSFGRDQLRIFSTYGPPTEPVYIMGTRNETAFANDNTDTKRVDANWLAACLNYRIFQQLKRLPNSGLLDTGWITSSLQDFTVEYERQRKKQAKRIEDAMKAEVPDTLIYRHDDRDVNLVR